MVFTSLFSIILFEGKTRPLPILIGDSTTYERCKGQFWPQSFDACGFHKCTIKFTCIWLWKVSSDAYVEAHYYGILHPKIHRWLMWHARMYKPNDKTNTATRLMSSRFISYITISIAISSTPNSSTYVFEREDPILLPFFSRRWIQIS